MVTGYIRSACEHFIVNYTDDVQQTFNLKNTAEKDLVNHNSHHWWDQLLLLGTTNLVGEAWASPTQVMLNSNFSYVAYVTCVAYVVPYVFDTVTSAGHVL